MILKVARMGHPVLRTRAAEVSKEEIASGAAMSLAADMFETMREYGGVGLAAPQVHVSKRLLVVDVPKNARRPDEMGLPMTVMVNPVVTPIGDEQTSDFEGCLSLPGLIGLVPRYSRILVQWTGLDGSPLSAELSGFAATVVQHECDHLDGVLYVDRIRDMTTFQFTEEYARFSRGTRHT